MHSVFVLLIVTPVLSAAPWIRMSSSHFEILTDAGHRAARNALTRFEQVRRVLLAGSEPAHDFPARILLFSSARDYATVRPAAHVSGLFQSGPERDYIIMLASAELDRVIVHEYTHSVLSHSQGRLPQWLEEGLCEFYSTVTVSGGTAVIGGPVESHLEVLSRSEWLAPAVLASVSKNSEFYNEAGKSGIFYAQSWAMVHMLAARDGNGSGLAAFVQRVARGEPQAIAFRSAFGKNWDDVSGDLRAYLGSGLRTTVRVVPPPEGDLYSEPSDLDAVAAVHARGEVLLLMGRDRDARLVYEEAARRAPDSPAAQSGLAVIAMRENDVESARARFEKALELGARDASTYFEYAMLLRDTGADPGLVTSFLEKTVAANPEHAEAHFLLGIRASDAARYSDAVSHLRQAVAILPRQAYFWQALSHANFKLGNVEEAKAAATRALANATTDHEREMARAALRLAAEPAKESPARRSGVITPDSWRNAKGDRSVSGRLAEVECSKGSARLHVRTGTGAVILEIADPTKVVLRGAAAQVALSCGTQPGTAVTVEYESTTMVVTAVEFH